MKSTFGFSTARAAGIGAVTRQAEQVNTTQKHRAVAFERRLFERSPRRMFERSPAMRIGHAGLTRLSPPHPSPDPSLTKFAFGLSNRRHDTHHEEDAAS